jgi:hypothetical protein
MTGATTVFAPRTAGNPWGYWRVEDLTDLPAATKRRRNSISFILTNEGLARFTREVGTPTCCYCHKGIEDDGKVKPYGTYVPRTKRAKVWHYECGWGALLDDIVLNDCVARRVLVPENIDLGGGA